MMQEITSRQRQAIETKERINRCALELFGEKDYEDVSIAEICKKAGVSAGHFYNYYESKESLLLAEYPAFDDFVKNEFILVSHDNFVSAIKDLIYKQTHGAEQVGATIFAQIMRLQLRTNGKYVTEDNRYFPFYLKELVQKAIDAGELIELHDAEEISQKILRLSRGVLFDWSMRRGSYSVSQKAIQDLSTLLQVYQPHFR